MTHKSVEQDIRDIQESIDATWDTIIGLEKSISEMEAELRRARRC